MRERYVCVCVLCVYVYMCVVCVCVYVYMCVVCVCVFVYVSTCVQETGVLYKSTTTQGHVHTAVTNHCHFYTLKRQRHIKVARHSRLLQPALRTSKTLNSKPSSSEYDLRTLFTRDTTTGDRRPPNTASSRLSN